MLPQSGREEVSRLGELQRRRRLGCHLPLLAGHRECGTSATMPAARAFDRLRNEVRQTFTVTRCSQFPKAASPRKPTTERITRTNTSCVASAASSRSASIRRHKA